MSAQPNGRERLTEEPLTDLLRNVGQQDRAAFREIYRLTSPRLAGVLTRILRDRSEVEDALQDVFIRIWQRATQFDATRGAPMAWLVTVARNVALDRVRARPEARGLARPETSQPQPDLIDQLVATGPGPEANVLAQSEARRVVNCFQELEQDRAEAVRGAYLQGLSYSDLAQRHDVPINTIRTWLRRSLLRLKECLDR